MSRCLWACLWPDVCRSAHIHRSWACLRPKKVCGPVCPDVCGSVFQGVHGPSCVKLFVGLFVKVFMGLPVLRCLWVCVQMSLGPFVSIFLQICLCPDVCGHVYAQMFAGLYPDACKSICPDVCRSICLDFCRPSCGQMFAGLPASIGHGPVCPDVCGSVCQGVPPCVEMFVGVCPDVCGSVCVHMCCGHVYVQMFAGPYPDVCKSICPDVCRSICPDFCQPSCGQMSAGLFVHVFVGMCKAFTVPPSPDVETVAKWYNKFCNVQF